MEQERKPARALGKTGHRWIAGGHSQRVFANLGLVCVEADPPSPPPSLGPAGRWPWNRVVSTVLYWVTIRCLNRPGLP